MRTPNPKSSFSALRMKPLVAATSAILAGTLTAHAQQASAPSQGAVLEEVVVTSQKREENLQSVPISIEAIDSKKLASLQVASFQDYSRYLPSLSVQSYGPGQSQLYVRGVTNGGDGLHVGSQPLVGLYFDEMPVTTIAQNLDVHIYDIQRVEALSGPQGTLFGASSMAGTMRIITNKPDPAQFEAGYDVAGEAYTMGAGGGKIEGFANIPLGEHAAIRLVGWGEHDGGYINQVAASGEYFPTSGVPRTNSQFVQKNSNPVDTAGGRAALKFDMNDHWTVLTTLMTQSQTAHGQTAYTPNAVTVQPTNGGPPMTLGGTGDLNVAMFEPNLNRDDWWMGTMVVEGKVGDFDLTYAGGFIKRDTYSIQDYSDYALFYDAYYANNPSYFGHHYLGSNGQPVSPAQYETGTNHFKKQSHEVRLSTPKDWRLHGVFGLFFERQFDDIRYDYVDPLLGAAYSVDGSPGSIFMDHAYRTDRDKAAFTDLTYDLTSQWALTGGIRLFHYDNTINGFSGWGLGFPPAVDGGPFTGENICTTPITQNPSAPCQNVNARASQTSETHRVNLTYKIDDEKMVYGTWSTGFRPGGINRIPSVPAYTPDYLTNFEIGTKTTWFDRRLRVNGAVFYERWKDAQFGYPGPNAVTVVTNAGEAAIKGIEAEVHWAVMDGLTLTESLTYLDTKLLTNVCHYLDPTFQCTNIDSRTGHQNSVYAPAGEKLPVSSKIKGNTIARYEWTTGEYRAHAQAAAVYQSSANAAIKSADEATIGPLPGYGTVDLALGVAHNNWTSEFYVKNALDNRGQGLRFTQCVPAVCNLVYVIPVQPRLVGLSFGQRF